MTAPVLSVPALHIRLDPQGASTPAISPAYRPKYYRLSEPEIMGPMLVVRA
jgi:hypothetical protein